MKESRKFIYYSAAMYAVYTAILYFSGFFKIGLLSDDYLNIYDALNSTLYQKLTGNLPFTNAFHIRPFYYLSLEKSIAISSFFGLGFDNFIWFRIQNLLLLVFTGFAAGLTVFYLTRRASVSLAASAAVIIYSNIISNICWMAARVDLICGFFYIVSILLFLIYSDTGRKLFFTLSVITFIFSLLTKELAITLPVTVFLFEFFRKGRQGVKKTYPLLAVLALLLVSYFVFRIAVLGNNMTEITTLYQAFPLYNAPGVYARALIALSIPLDFITLNFQLRNDNKIIILYLVILYGSAFYLFWSSLRADLYRIIGQLAAFFFVLITPYAVVGYIRPQMIFLPFTVIAIYFLFIYNRQRNTSIVMKKSILKIAFASALIFWGYWSVENINEWDTSYSKSIENVNRLIEVKHDPSKRMVLIGNPGRYRQAFMFDKMTGAYNFWKEKQFVIKDTINDIIQSAAFTENSIGAKFEVKNLSEREFEIKAIAPKQFFYIEGYNPERIRSGFKNNDIAVEFTEYNIVDKPIKMTLRILNDNIECYLAEELGFRKIF